MSGRTIARSSIGIAMKPAPTIISRAVHTPIPKGRSMQRLAATPSALPANPQAALANVVAALGLKPDAQAADIHTAIDAVIAALGGATSAPAPSAEAAAMRSLTVEQRKLVRDMGGTALNFIAARTFVHGPTSR